MPILPCKRQAATRTCGFCGGTFRRPVSRLGRFCSRVCYASARRNGLVRVRPPTEQRLIEGSRSAVTVYVVVVVRPGFCGDPTPSVWSEHATAAEAAAEAQRLGEAGDGSARAECWVAKSNGGRGRQKVLS